MNNSSREDGFTLVELMIVIAIIGIIAAIAVPQYGHYTKVARFSDLVIIASDYKSSIAVCMQLNQDLDDCDANSHGIPPNITIARKNLESLTVENGRITMEATDKIDGATYIGTPSLLPSAIEWKITGSCVGQGLC